MSAEGSVYLDASALVKLVVPEPESVTLASFVGSRRWLTSCGLARVEVVRAVVPHGVAAVSTARTLLDRLELVQLDDELLDLAGELAGRLRLLDAVHVAAAIELGDELEVLVTYDTRMASAARSFGLPIAAPS